MSGQPRKGTPTPSTSPWEQHFGDPDADLWIRVVFDETTRAITGGTVHRDAACQWSHISLGLGPDNTPNTSPDTWHVSTGEWAIPASEFAAHDLNTIEDVEALQITAW